MTKAKRRRWEVTRESDMAPGDTMLVTRGTLQVIVRDRGDQLYVAIWHNGTDAQFPAREVTCPFDVEEHDEEVG